MPEISRFYGIVITMYFDEHNPPHFHAKYNDMSAVFKIEDLAKLEGNLPSKALGLVIEWASMHQDELFENWKLSVTGKNILKIKPL